MKLGIIKSLVIALLAGFSVSCSESGENEPQPTYTVTVSATEGGTAAANKNTCPEGEEVTATATADEGYLFAGWYENGETIATEVAYSFVMPARNVVLQARFEQEAVVPAAASRDGETVSNQVGQRGCYWSGTLYPGNDARYAYYFYFYEGNQQPARNNRRYMGYSVRPVKE